MSFEVDSAILAYNGRATEDFVYFSLSSFAASVLLGLGRSAPLFQNFVLIKSARVSRRRSIIHFIEFLAGFHFLIAHTRKKNPCVDYAMQGLWQNGGKITNLEKEANLFVAS